MASSTSTRTSPLRAAYVTALLALVPAFAAAQSSNGSTVSTKYNVLPFIKMSLTPNYASGFGPVKSVLGGATTVLAPGSFATLNGGAVDFGTVQQGVAYLYRYAAKITVTSNATQFTLFAQGSADLTGTSDTTNAVPASGSTTGNTMPINQTLFWLTSTSGGGDPNTGYSAAQPFISANATWNSPTVPGTGAQIYHGAISSTANLYYDYQLRVPPTASIDNYFVYVVYTVIPS